jgi:nitric oxide dioxygenase
MANMLSESTIATVKATVPALEAHGLEMYARMFRDAEIRDLFNQSHHGETGSQPKALTAAIPVYAKNIDSLGALTPAVERIAQKHVGLRILPEHDPHVGEALLGAIEHVLGDAATEEFLTAWSEAYWFLADVPIAHERALYQEAEGAEGGWSGWREFEIAEVRPENAIIASFLLSPADGRPAMRHRPGQYLTLALEIPGHPPLKHTYSVSSEPDGTSYRITVKREERGIASGWLHERAAVGTRVKVGAPAGEFVLPERPERPERPVVLLSGGTGLTPMVAMLETVAERHPDLPVHFPHGTLDGAVHAMGGHVRAVAARCPEAQVTVFYQLPRPQGVEGHDYERRGVIDEAWLRSSTPVGEADYFLCGPRPFLRALVSPLARAGVPGDRIHHEFFGPADELLAA